MGGRSTRRPEESKASYLHGSPVVEAVAVDVLGRPLALARRDEIPPCTHGEALRSPCTIRSRSRGRGGGWICAYRRSRGRSGTGTGPRRRPRCRSPTAAGSAATTPTPTTPPPAPAAPPSTIHRSLPPRSYNPPPPIRNPSSSSSSPRSIDRSIESKPTTTSRGRGWRLLGAVVD